MSTFFLQYDSAEYNLYEFCKSQRLLLLSAMAFLNMAVVLVSDQNYIGSNNIEVAELSRYNNILSILGFIAIYMIYTGLLTKPDFFSILEYIISSLLTFVLSILWAFYLKMKLEYRIAKINP